MERGKEEDGSRSDRPCGVRAVKAREEDGIVEVEVVEVTCGALLEVGDVEAGQRLRLHLRHQSSLPTRGSLPASRRKRSSRSHSRAEERGAAAAVQQRRRHQSRAARQSRAAARRIISGRRYLMGRRRRSRRTRSRRDGIRGRRPRPQQRQRRRRRPLRRNERVCAPQASLTFDSLSQAHTHISPIFFRLGSLCMHCFLFAGSFARRCVVDV